MKNESGIMAWIKIWGITTFMRLNILYKSLLIDLINFLK